MLRHPPSDARRCVLLFTRSPRREARAKGLPGGEALFASLLGRTLAAASALPDTDLVIAGDPGDVPLPPGARVLPQRGGSFGERLAGAFADAAALGYRLIVAAGSDSPGLGAETLRAAFAALERGPVVLGPAPDGGVCLLGLDAGRTAPGRLLSGIDWRTDRVLAQLVARCPGAAVLADALADVDGRSGLAALLAAAALDPELAALARALLASRPARPLPAVQPAPRRLRAAAVPQRGPPPRLLLAA